MQLNKSSNLYSIIVKIGLQNWYIHRRKLQIKNVGKLLFFVLWKKKINSDTNKKKQ